MRPARSDDFRLPDLRFVPVESLIPHEQHDLQRMEPLVQRLREQGVLRNPPIVTPMAAVRPEDPRFMVLDGANRSTAARAAGLPHCVVQVVRYEAPDVTLSTWHHALSEMDLPSFEAACAAVPELEMRREAIMHARAELARREIIAYAVGGADHAVTFRGGATLDERNTRLNALVDVYRSRRFYRMSTETFDVATQRHPDVATLVVFPHFEPAEVLELSTSGARLPAGITRHLIRWRALRLNIPLERLADAGTPIENKNRWLEAWVHDKHGHRQVRFYEEPTVMFDE
jgi:hypothetical protein